MQQTLKEQVKNAFVQAPASFVFGDDDGQAVSDGQCATLQMISDRRASLVVAITPDEALMRRGTNLVLLLLLAAGFGNDAPNWVTLMLSAAQLGQGQGVTETVRRGGRVYVLAIDRVNGLITVMVEEPEPVKRGKPR